MKMRKYIVIDVGTECQDIIAKGTSNFYDNPVDVIPDGYITDIVQNTPDLVKIYVKHV